MSIKIFFRIHTIILFLQTDIRISRIYKLRMLRHYEYVNN